MTFILQAGFCSLGGFIPLQQCQSVYLGPAPVPEYHDVSGIAPHQHPVQN